MLEYFLKKIPNIYTIISDPLQRLSNIRQVNKPLMLLILDYATQCQPNKKQLDPKSALQRSVFPSDFLKILPLHLP